MPSFFVNLGLVPGFVAIIAAAADLRGDQGFLRSASVVRLGQWSFALYLVHGPILRLAAPSFRHGGMAPALSGGVIVVMIAVALSGTLYEWVEKPAEKRLRGLFAPRSATELRLGPRALSTSYALTSSALLYSIKGDRVVPSRTLCLVVLCRGADLHLGNEQLCRGRSRPAAAGPDLGYRERRGFP